MKKRTDAVGTTGGKATIASPIEIDLSPPKATLPPNSILSVGKKPTTAQKMIMILDNMIAGNRKRLSEWRDKFDADAVEAFAWGHDAIEDACRVNVFDSLRRKLATDNVNVADVMYDATRFALTGARHVGGSSSPTRNLVNQHTTAAYAEFVEYFRNWKEL
jgi:hypothetical protein